MKAIGAAALFSVFVIAGCGSSDGVVARGAQVLPVIGAAISSDAGRLLGRVTPSRPASYRSHPPRSATGGRASGSLCGTRGIEGTTIAPITSEIAGCGVAQPVRVTHVDGVKLSQSAIMDCDTARALHKWVRKGAKPAIGRRGGGIAELHVPAHYACRPMNHRPGAPVSEHGRGRAIDISGMTLANGQHVSVLDDWRGSRHSAALRRMHRAACGTFTTTLGPGSDGMHEDHFHYDLAQRRNGPICR